MSSTRTPPRFVPTLTEVVQGAPASLGGVPGVSPDQLAQRVLQRVDLVLDRRVREAIATVVLEQTNALAPLLRERLETAVAEEMQARQRGGA
jgi:hypothetical protein